MTACLIRGSGDIGSAVAHALFVAGLPVVVHDVAAPSHHRRGRAFVDALYDGSAWLEEVQGVRASDLDEVRSLVAEREAIAISAAPFEELLEALGPRVLVDARMRKRERPEGQRALAPLTVGLGPNFVAGDTTHLVVETAWGTDLGRVIRRGPSRAFTGEPRVVAGHGRDRYVYAPLAGTMRAAAAIGMPVLRGIEVGRIGGTLIHAPLDGVLVGLTRSGAPVRLGAKILEVDPRGDGEAAFRIGERASTIADGVMRALGGAGFLPARNSHRRAAAGSRPGARK